MPSSVVAKFEYDAAHACLTVTFVTGRAYQYFAVPAAVADEFRNAFSKGVFFNTRIRDKYPYRQTLPANRTGGR